ncbi:MAG: UDP-3-O-(3-hydroxymyristoyl)glucosamine N-acyltransferase, partial [Sinobacteraceae bacterium]|nr:UDP-3-O-(3-hydroxymyristoyl)glucosamine N-acyltransferase [Nevskiaceae bacterium]
MPFTLEALASRFSLQWVGDGECVIGGVCALEPGVGGCLSYCCDPRHYTRASRTQASALVVAEPVPGYAGSLLLAQKPILAFARIANLFDDAYDMTAGVHDTAVVAEGARVADTAWVG